MTRPTEPYNVQAIAAEVLHSGGRDQVPWLHLTGLENRRTVLRLDAVLGWHVNIHRQVRLDTVNRSYSISGRAAEEVDNLLGRWLIGAHRPDADPESAENGGPITWG